MKSLRSPFLIVAASLALVAHCQLPQFTHSVEGYITAVVPPDGFEVNGTLLKTIPETQYRALDERKPPAAAHLKADLQVGVYVKVDKEPGRPKNSPAAQAIYFRDDAGKNLDGFGLIDKVILSGAEPVFRADGYKIRITSATKSTFHSDLKSLADVKTNVWIKYSGKRDSNGVLQALSADFYQAKHIKEKSDKQSAELEAQMRTYNDPNGSVAHDSLINWEGRLVGVHTKVRMADAGRYCGWYRVPADKALQERVRRVGARIVPLFQKEMADDDPMKIQFRFYAVEEPKLRFDIECENGIVLVPRQVVDRLQNDDQLAALLTNGVAWYLQIRSAKLAKEQLAILGMQLAGDIVAQALVPEVFFAGDVVADIAQRKVLTAMQQQRGRMAVALMADAGYDPWQAPEAWRLLAPKELPDDLDSLKYPNRAGYQLGILHLQYSTPRPASQ